MDTEGHLDQYLYRCDASCNAAGWTGGASLCDVFSLDTALNTRTSPRAIYTQVDGTIQPLTAANTAITPDFLGVPSGGILLSLDQTYGLAHNPTGKTTEIGDASIPANRVTYKDQLIRLLRADPGSRREAARLGAIYNSQPAIQADLFSVNAPVPSFLAYRAQASILARPTVLFVGTNEGLLHAFRVDRDPLTIDDPDFGTELWAFLPALLAGRANDLALGSVNLLDGSPVVKDLRLRKPSSGVDLATEVASWRSILVSGYGGGGRGLFALDVTDPTNPVFKWELSNSRRCFRDTNGTHGCQASDALARLGNTFSSPVLANSFFSFNSVLQDRALVVLGGGGAIRDDAQAGKAIFVLDLDTGTVVREFCNSCGNVLDNSPAQANTPGFDCALEGSVTAYDEAPSAQLSRAFLGDACGQLWRLDLRAENPEDWTVSFFADLYPDQPLDAAGLALRRPIRNRPALATGDQNGRFVVIAATGDANLATPIDSTDRIISVSEVWDQESGTFTAATNWFHSFQTGELFTSGVVITAKTAYFTTELVGAGQCGIGEGRLWGVHFTGHEMEAIDDVEPALDLDGNYITINDLVLYRPFDDSEVFGLSLLQTPSCSDALTNYLPWANGIGAVVPLNSVFPTGAGTSGASFAGTTSGSLEIVVQTGAAGEQSPGLSPPNGASGTGNKAKQTLPPPARFIQSIGLGILFD
jgi:hypothetical protein